MSYSIALQYMIVDKGSLQVKPISDELLKHELGAYGNESENGIITWVRENVLHAIELRSTKAESNFNTLENGFADNVKLINKILTQWNAVLLPTAAHPLMNPQTETKLWPYDHNETQDIYQQLFNYQSHPWSNTQRTLVQLPFKNDAEFGNLHAAIRALMPLIPALSSSSPLIEGKRTGYLQSSLSFHKNSSPRIPSLTERIIPEPIFFRRNYEENIYGKIKKEITDFTNSNEVNIVDFNFRGAVPHFDNGRITIRMMDVQECPAADLAIITLVIETLKALVAEKFAPRDDLKEAFTDALSGILDETAQHGQGAEIYSTEYSSLFGINSFITPKELWNHIYDTLTKRGNTALERWEPELSIILEEGTLSDRILKELKGDTSEGSIKKVYRELSDCLAQNKMFLP